MALARSGDRGRLWVTARRQTKGRGRSGRSWSSPEGNLYASLLLIDPAPVRIAPELGFVTGVAAAHALRRLLGGDERITIKWPNDILHGKAKVCGILLESAFLEDGKLACAIGIGVNCQNHPKDTPYPATDLSAAAGVRLTAEDAFLELSMAMAHWLGIWEAGQHFGVIRSEWLSLAAAIGGLVKVVHPSQTIEGTFESIDGSGRLILKTASGRAFIEAGDVFFSPLLTSGTPLGQGGAMACSDPANAHSLCEDRQAAAGGLSQ
jgi:BirA family biotin operon repressor/biotin-[acetyl-CoA-carboxylase] ligase